MNLPILIVLLVALAACTTPSVDPVSSTSSREARAQIRRLEKVLISNRDPHGFDYQTFVRALHEAGREVEAEALADYTDRTFRGEPTNKPFTIRERKECVDQHFVRRWGGTRSQPDSFIGQVGRLAANFWIGSDARIEKIRVIRARDPGAAWLIIDSIGEARVSKSRVRRMSEENTAAFPIELCTWWNYDKRKDGLPAGSSIRGF